MHRNYYCQIGSLLRAKISGMALFDGKPYDMTVIDIFSKTVKTINVYIFKQCVPHVNNVINDMIQIDFFSVQA